MKKPDHYDENGVPVFTAASMFRPDENVYIHMSTDFQEFVGVAHKHAFIEIIYVISGEAIHETVSGSYKVTRGDVVVVNYDTPHAFHEQPGEERFTAYDLMFTPDFLDTSLISTHDFGEMCSSMLFYSLFPAQKAISYADSPSHPVIGFSLFTEPPQESGDALFQPAPAIGPDLHLSGSSYRIFGELFSRIYIEFTGRQKGYLGLVRAYVTELIIHLFRKLDSTAEGTLSARQKQAVEAAVSYLRENYHTHITLEELALHIFLSKDYLNRIFRESTGMPVNAFLQKLRVEEACRLLTTTEIAVTEVAAACGFGDSKAFYSTFKRITGTTPGEFRARSKN
ncbi:MAG: helix-turn-helix domain-containing protein [Ruminococcaceae bacterium]|nr:helix-turn-helix domain-containing protein [Oscillospiraceae bacterium]